jgi:hypothetical protein
MTRLIMAYSQKVPKAAPTANAFRQRGCETLRRFLDDLAIRNWGDTSLVDHTKHEWLEEIWYRNEYLEKFVRAMGTTLEKRREQPMILERYFISED